MKITFHRLAACATLAIAATLPVSVAQGQSQKVLKFIPQADLRILDPISTTAYITRNHGYMVYDTLFAMDEKFQVKPQMVDKFDVSKDQLTYTFTLRDGLKFHDGQPVRSADCIASIDRWSKRDALGQKLAEATESWSAVDDKTFRLKLKKPFPLTLGSARQAVVERAVHHAGTYCQDRPIQEHRRYDRLGSFQIRESGMGARKQSGLRQEHRLCAAQGAAVLGFRRQSGQGRPGRMDLHS